jgi:hypothetical protein
MNQTTASSILIYGDSGVGKSSQLPNFARFVLERTGRKTRMVSVEASGAKRVASAIDAGLIIPFWLTHNPRSALPKLIRGEWPVAVNDAGSPVADASQATKLRYLPTPPAEWDEIGAYAFEGTASMAELIVDCLRREGRKIQQDVVGLYQEDGENLGAAAPSHHGAAQQDIGYLLNEAPRGLFAASKGKVLYVLFTGHEAKGVDKDTQAGSTGTVYGVGTTGTAFVGKIPKKVGTLLHFVKDSKARKIWVYFDDHPDEENQFKIWKAKADLPAHPGVMAALEKKWPGGRFELTLGNAKNPVQTLYDYMVFQEGAEKFMAEQTRELMEKVQASRDNAGAIPINVKGATK